MLNFVEIAVIGIAVLVIFGSSKLPKLGRSIGEGLVEFKKGLKVGVTEDSDKSKGQDKADKIEINETEKELNDKKSNIQ